MTASSSSPTPASTCRCSTSSGALRVPWLRRPATAWPSRPSGARRSTTPPSRPICASPGQPETTGSAPPGCAFPRGSLSRPRSSRASATGRTRTRPRHFICRRAGGGCGLPAAAQLHGPELGYNNLLDWSAALALLLEFEDPAAVVIKHTNPCGVALGRSVSEAVRRAKACDPVSIYGGIVGVERRVGLEVVKELSGILLEVLFAPEFEPDALEELRMTKKKCRVFQLPCTRAAYPSGLSEHRSVLGGLLVQDADQTDLDPRALTVVSRRPPTEAEIAALRFAWRVAKHAKPNAIVLSTADEGVGV